MNLELQKAIDAFDLEEYLGEKGGEETHAGQWVLRCPTCSKKKLAVNTDKRAWHCWVCERYGEVNLETGKRRILQGAGGLLDLMQFLEGWDRGRAAQFVISQSLWQPDSIEYIETPDLAGTPPGLRALEIRTIPAVMFPLFWKPIDRVLPYMATRGLTLEDAHAFGLVYCDAGRYAGRLIFPVWEDGRMIYYQGRAMFGQQPKALNPPRQEGAAVSNEVLFNLDQAKHYPRVAVVEGPLDSVRTGRDSVCTFGKMITPIQIKKLLRAGVRAIDLMWDGPKKGKSAWAEMIEVGPTLASLFDTRLVFLPHGDPDAWPREALNVFRAQGCPVGAMSKIAAV